MNFIWPIMLLSLVLVPLFIGIYILMQQRRRKLSANFSKLGLAAGGNGRLNFFASWQFFASLRETRVQLASTGVTQSRKVSQSR